MRRIAFVICLLLSVSNLAFAVEQSSAKSLVELGLNAYLKDGANAAIQAWVKGSALEKDTKALSQANSLRQVEDFYGKPESFDVIRENIISPRAHMVVFAVNYSKGVLFGRFQAYQTREGTWVATEFQLHTDSTALLPAEIVFGK